MIGCLRFTRVCFMIFIPLPFVSSLLMLLLMAVLLHRFGWRGANRPFLLVLGLCALQSLIVGLRWGYGITELRFVLPVVASCLPGLTLMSFRSLIHQAKADDTVLVWFHALPPFVIAAMVYFAPGLIDAALIGLYVGYALALLLLGGAPVPTPWMRRASIVRWQLIGRLSLPLHPCAFLPCSICWWCWISNGGKEITQLRSSAMPICSVCSLSA